MGKKEKLEKFPLENDFRMRGIETTRLDTFVDAAFAFAVTMLVISIGNVPDNYSELILALKGTPAFAMSFAAVIIFWLGHRRWSRRYGIEDGKTIFLSLSLIFVVLVYVYPLRLVFSAFASWISGGWLPSEMHLTSASELINLFVLYGFGFAALTLLMALLNLRALKLKDSLQLRKFELVVTQMEVAIWMVLTVTGVLSGLFAALFPEPLGAYAGFVYFNLPISMNLVVFIYRRKARRLKIKEVQL